MTTKLRVQVAGITVHVHRNPQRVQGKRRAFMPRGRPTNGGELQPVPALRAHSRWPIKTRLRMPKPTAPPSPSTTRVADSAQNRPPAPRSDPLSLPREKAYAICLRFRPKRPGIAAFDWVAVWHGKTGRERRSFPLEAYGFEEALQGAATTVLMETGIAIPPFELECAATKEHRVVAYIGEMLRLGVRTW